MSPTQTQLDFYHRVKTLTLDTTGNVNMATLAACMAVQETGWGQHYPVESNNLFGIKPGRNHPAHPGHPHLRKFISERACITSWFYLMVHSSHYTSQRAIMRLRIKTARSNHEQQVAAAHQNFLKDIAPIYSPSDHNYARDVLLIWRNTERT